MNDVKVIAGIEVVKVIAEIGWNFMGDMSLAEQMIHSAKDSGADVAKFQYWNPSRLKAGAWDEDGRRQIYEKAQLSELKINELRGYCDDAGLDFLVSAFNVHDAKFLKNIGLDAIKIPSHEVANVELHGFCAENFSEVYVSLGAGTQNEVETAIDVYVATSRPSSTWVGMHCVSSYPVAANNANLPRLKYLANKVPILGYSDHTSDTVTPALAVAMGARVIEKHFTVDKELPGRDNKFALESSEFCEMVKNIRIAEQAIISHGSGPLDIESDTMAHYRGRWGDND
jgi:sialic acid synthase SpsE